MVTPGGQTGLNPEGIKAHPVERTWFKTWWVFGISTYRTPVLFSGVVTIGRLTLMIGWAKKKV